MVPIPILTGLVKTAIPFLPERLKISSRSSMKNHIEQAASYAMANRVMIDFMSYTGGVQVAM